MRNEIPQKIKVRGARVHNLKNVNVDIPLNQIVGIAGISGSGKSSLALGVLYAEGSRRYLESLSTYTRRRMTQAAKADVDEVLYVPASLALHQRPAIPGIRSTFGTGTELLNSLRLMFSRLGSHRCPNGHYLRPSMNVALDQELVCPECGEHFYGPGAEELAFNSQGACPRCEGTGIVHVVDESTLVPDENLTIDEGAVLPWQTLMWSLMKDIARDLGVRTDVPFKDLTEKERDIVFHGPAVKHHVIYQNQTSGAAGEMDFTYFNAIYTVENALSKVKDESGMKRVEKFLRISTCPDCGGTRLSEKARVPKIMGINLADACAMTLSQSIDWVKRVPDSMPDAMRQMAKNIVGSYLDVAKRLMDLGLSYLTLDRAASTLSTGERQRMQLARAVRNRTTGVLYVLDEPSIGLHPANIIGLIGVMRDLIADGNSVLLVDHDTQILKEADWLIEMGPKAGADGGRVIAEGTLDDISANPGSMIGPFLAGRKKIMRTVGQSDFAPNAVLAQNTDLTQQSDLAQNAASAQNMVLAQQPILVQRADLSQNTDSPQSPDLFENGHIVMETKQIHTVKPLHIDIPKGKLTVVTGVSGSGKTTMVLESLVPALNAVTAGERLPEHVVNMTADGIRHVKLIDASPIGINVRSTVATYANVHDELRKIYARGQDARQRGFKAGDFSYNTGKLRCTVCDGTGSISLDVQFLPDVDIPCPECKGSRYSKDAYKVMHSNKSGETKSLPELMEMDVNTALGFCRDMKNVYPKLQVLMSLGLGYLTLGEETPSLSGGEAQRLKLASEMGRPQTDSVFVFDEPTIGLHPLDVETLLGVFQTLIDTGATVVVIEHDLDVIRNADYIIDMGPGGGEEGGRIVVCGTPDEIRNCGESVTGRFI